MNNCNLLWNKEGGIQMNVQNKQSISTWDKVAPNFGKIGPKYWSCFGNRLVELSSISSRTKKNGGKKCGQMRLEEYLNK